MIRYPNLCSLIELNNSEVVGEVGQKLAEVSRDSSFSEAIKVLTQGKCLIRASKLHTEKTYQVSPKTSRRIPTHTDSGIDQFLENVRKKKFKHYPSRQHSVFCFSAPVNDLLTYAKDVPRLYGGYHLFVLAPNGSKYFQSKSVVDFYTSLHADDISNVVIWNDDGDKSSSAINEKSAKESASLYWQNGVYNLRSVQYKSSGNREVFFEPNGAYWAFSILEMDREAKERFLPLDKYIYNCLEK